MAGEVERFERELEREFQRDVIDEFRTFRNRVATTVYDVGGALTPVRIGRLLNSRGITDSPGDTETRGTGRLAGIEPFDPVFVRWNEDYASFVNDGTARQAAQPFVEPAVQAASLLRE